MDTLLHSRLPALWLCFCILLAISACSDRTQLPQSAQQTQPPHQPHQHGARPAGRPVPAIHPARIPEEAAALVRLEQTNPTDLHAAADRFARLESLMVALMRTGRPMEAARVMARGEVERVRRQLARGDRQSRKDAARAVRQAVARLAALDLRVAAMSAPRPNHSHPTPTHADAAAQTPQQRHQHTPLQYAYAPAAAPQHAVRGSSGEQVVQTAAFAATSAVPQATPQVAPRSVQVEAAGEYVTVTRAVPTVETGAALGDFAAAFETTQVPVEEGFAEIIVDGTPVFVEERPRLAPPPDLSPDENPYGVHPATFEGETPPFAHAQELGLGWNRGATAWWREIQDDAAIRAGRYDFAQLDAQLASTPEAMATLVNIMLPERLAGDTPRRAGAPPPPPAHAAGDRTWTLKHDPETYEAFVQRLVQQLERHGERHLQFENEFDLSRASHDPQGFARLMRRTCGAVKAANPEAFLVMGGFSGKDGAAGFARSYGPVLQALAALPPLENGAPCMDAFDVHHFGQAHEWRRLEEVYTAARQTLDANGFAGVPIWMTEIGTYSGAIRQPPWPPQSEAEQAAGLIKLLTTARGLGAPRTFWAWGMMEGFHHQDHLFDHTGLLHDGRGGGTGRGVKKLAYASYRLLVAKTAGAPAAPLHPGHGVHGAYFQREDGKVYVLWAEAE